MAGGGDGDGALASSNMARRSIVSSEAEATEPGLLEMAGVGSMVGSRTVGPGAAGSGTAGSGTAGATAQDGDPTACDMAQDGDATTCNTAID